MSNTMELRSGTVLRYKLAAGQTPPARLSAEQFERSPVVTRSRRRSALGLSATLVDRLNPRLHHLGSATEVGYSARHDNTGRAKSVSGPAISSILKSVGALGANHNMAPSGGTKMRIASTTESKGEDPTSPSLSLSRRQCRWRGARRERIWF